MQTATTQRTVKARSKAPKKAQVAYPELPRGASGGEFFLAAWLIEMAEYEGLQTLINRASFGKEPKALRYGVFAGAGAILDRAKISLEYVVRDGMLPFAHAHTTYFDLQVAA